MALPKCFSVKKWLSRAALGPSRHGCAGLAWWGEEPGGALSSPQLQLRLEAQLAAACFPSAAGGPGESQNKEQVLSTPWGKAGAVGLEVAPKSCPSPARRTTRQRDPLQLPDGSWGWWARRSPCCWTPGVRVGTGGELCPSPSPHR